MRRGEICSRPPGRRSRREAIRHLGEGTFEGPIVPIGLRPPEPLKHQRSKDEDNVENIACLQGLDEPPEGSPKVSEGGSSGSGDPMPPLEADPPNAVPSNVEGLTRKVAEVPAIMDREAYVRLEEEFTSVAKVEDLRPEDRKSYEAVREVGVGVCARCRWRYGCQSCDEAKAWGWACRSTLWHTVSEGVRPMAKPRGRPKKT